MIMPFQEQFLGLYDMLKNKFGDKYEFSNAGDLDNQQSILQDIVHWKIHLQSIVKVG